MTSGVIGQRDLVAASRVIRRDLGELLRQGRRLLVLGGDCSLLIGAMAAVLS